MKLTTFLLTIACLGAAARGTAQTIKLDVKDAPLERVFAQIKKQSDYSFVYYKDDLAKGAKITLRLTSADIEEVLQLVLKNQPLSYKIVDHTIVIAKKEDKSRTTLNDVEGMTNAPPPIDVKGRILNENGEPVLASIVAKGTNKGTTSDANGYFELKGVDDDATLVITASNIETREIKLNGRSELGVVGVKMSVESLNEVVINKGYYTEKQRLSAANVSVINANDIERQPVTNPLLALQGRVPGLVITQATGSPGGVVNVRIQGQSSMFRGTDPFYVIDGVPYSSQLLTTSGIANLLGQSNSVFGGSGNPLAFINPSDIEKIEVLKDADATAIYGSRAANGAILITTKRGKAGPAKVSISIQNGWGKVNRFLDLMNTKQYLTMRHEAKRNDNASIASADYDLNGLWDTTRNTNWQKELIGKTAHYINAHANVSGGTELFQYLIGSTYQRQTSTTPGSFANAKTTIHFNINSFSENKRFNILLSGSLTNDQNTMVATDFARLAIRLAPNAPAVYNADGSINWAPNSSGTSTWDNPLALLDNPYEVQTKNLIGNSVLSYKLLPNLQIKANLGYNELSSDEFAGYKLSSYRPEDRPFVARAAEYHINKIRTWLAEPQLNYKLDLRGNSFDVLLGSTFQTVENKGLALRGRGYSSDALMKDVRSASSLVVNNSVASTYNYNALFSRINYNLQDKYIINLTGRRDGSSRFGANNLFNNFWGVGIAWIFSEEDFSLKNLAFINHGKLRFSYGTTGNDQIGDYQFMDLFSVISAQIPYQNITSITPIQHANPGLQWEETKKFNGGIDLLLFNERVNLSVNYVLNRSSNQLINYTLPIQTGFATVTQNFPAKLQNQEWQFSLKAINFRTNSFDWSTGVNITIPKNKLAAFPGIETTGYANILIVGQPVDAFKLYKYLGVDPISGLYLIADRDGKPTTTPSLADRVELVSQMPKLYGGVQNTFRFKSFELDVLFQFLRHYRSNYFGGTSRPGARALNEPVAVLDRWQKPGDHAATQRFTTLTGAINTAFNAMRSSDAAYTDASFIRLKNVSISYTFPQSWLRRVKMSSGRIFASGQNLATITSYNGWDPESGTTALPPLRVITIGFNASF